MTDTNDSNTDSSTEPKPESHPESKAESKAEVKKDPTPSGEKGSAPPKSTAKPGRKARQPGGGKGKKTLLTLIVLVVLGLVAAVGYGSWTVWQIVQEQDTELAELDDDLKDQSETLAQQRRTLEQQSSQLEQMPQRLRQQVQQDLEQVLREQNSDQSELLANLEQRLNRVDRRLSAIAGTNREDWKLAEAEYLLRLANQRLVLERDSQNALALAQTADAILRDLDDSNLLPVRRALASDIQALKLTDPVDREGLYLQLLALGEQIPNLPLVEPLSERTPDMGDTSATPEADAEPEADGAWDRVKQSFGRVLQRLSNHIRIRRHEEPITALADPREQFYLRQQLQLMLEQAQAALLREEGEIFRTSLNRAAGWLEEHYTLNPQTREVRATLLELAETPIAPELPDLNDALNRLESHIEQLHRLSPDFQQAPDNGSDEESDS
ncbi:uroporphyrinogen-III C-methyltransferase [Marinimicrobium sp. C2-29]|uniref:uroporphyrinogen-III C-methyltransferase n=1 Tax=Marinimicrobium sp. C2-29 TaxID=3139825 RepID=UPI00313A2B1D